MSSTVSWFVEPESRYKSGIFRYFLEHEESQIKETNKAAPDFAAGAPSHRHISEHRSYEKQRSHIFLVCFATSAVVGQLHKGAAFIPTLVIQEALGGGHGMAA